MAIAYISMSILLCAEMLTQPNSPDIRLTRSVALLVSAIQACLFTYTFINLINLQFATRKRIIFESSTLLAICGIMVFGLFFSTRYFDLVFYLSIFCYILMLVRYTIIFLEEYRHYALQVANFFSDDSPAPSNWVYYSFFASLVIGSGALLLTFSEHTIHYIIFTSIFIVFYCYFGVKFIKYSYSFYRIEPILLEPAVPINIPTHNVSKMQLAQRISEWIKEEKYIQSGITIKHLSEEFNTNRTYLSNYINHTENKTFREWINHLRIEKAKKILLDSPNQSISEVAMNSGYTDSSNFNRQFVKNTGVSANAWRRQKLNNKPLH